MPVSKLIIGVDEAGYGPSMGPLTICATVWRIPEELDANDMSSLLEPEFLAKPLKSDSLHIPIGDSKKIHRDKLAEQGLMLGASFLAFAVGETSYDNWDSCLRSFANHDWNRLSKVPWYVQRPVANKSLAPFAASISSDRAAAAIAKLDANAIQIVGIRLRVLDEVEFNKEVDRTGNKSTLLSECSLGLVREVIALFSKQNECVEVYCDKHGGRNRYQGILCHMFDEAWFSIEEEGRDCSRYAASWNGNPMKIQFKVDGDSLFPSAAASIVAKWTREYLMERLNGFWQDKVQGDVAPTAGYYVDAVRFAKQIEKSAAQLGLERESWWRKK